jgi:hypothetical protein
MGYVGAFFTINLISPNIDSFLIVYWLSNHYARFFAVSDSNHTYACA